MRLLSILLVVAGVGVGATTAYIATSGTPVEPAPAAAPGEFVSGPQVGAKLPGTFEPLHINGPDAGEQRCVVCTYGNNPVVMVFATRIGSALEELVGRLEKAAAGAKRPVGACVVLTDTSEATRSELKKLGDRQNLKHVILAVINPGELKRFALHPDAEETVICYTKQTIRVNQAFKVGELTLANAAGIARRAAEHFAAN